MTTCKPEYLDQDKTGGVRCPLCGFATRVMDSREGTANSVRRRRRCLASACGCRFTTYETIYDETAPVDHEQYGILLARASDALVMATERLADVVKASKAAKLIMDLTRK